MVSVLCFLEVVDSVLFVVNEVLVIMYKMESDDLYIIAVTPLAGVWIEIKTGSMVYRVVDVTPLAGVWIEISVMSAVL